MDTGVLLHFDSRESTGVKYIHACFYKQGLSSTRLLQFQGPSIVHADSLSY